MTVVATSKCKFAHMKSASPQSNNHQDQDQPLPQFQPALLSDVELLSKLLYPGKSQEQDTGQAETLLQCFGGLRGLQIASRVAADERAGRDDQAAIQIRL